MITEAINSAATATQRMPQAFEQIDINRKKVKEEPETDQGSANAKSNKIQPEELLQQIKALTEDGLFSVRFENDARTNQLVVKIVDSETQEVIRQVPAEALLGLRAALDELRGNLVDTKS